MGRNRANRLEYFRQYRANNKEKMKLYHQRSSAKKKLKAIQDVMNRQESKLTESYKPHHVIALGWLDGKVAYCRTFNINDETAISLALSTIQKMQHYALTDVSKLPGVMLEFLIKDGKAIAK
jgi:hypothetical protein